MDKSKIIEFIKRGEDLAKYGKPIPGHGTLEVSGPEYDAWMSEIKIYNERYLKAHPLYQDISNTVFLRSNINSYNKMMGYLRALEKDHEFFDEPEEEKQIVKRITEHDYNNGQCLSKKVFIVHGHDNEAIQEMARTLEKGGFESIILHEQPDAGLTIIEKIERYTDVCYAVVLYTECDIGRDKNAPVDQDKYRSRQNVVFEHGYLIARLGRKRVSALVKGDVETPSDISGVVYINMDKAGAWKIQLAKNMSDVGLCVDMNKMCG